MFTIEMLRSCARRRHDVICRAILVAAAVTLLAQAARAVEIVSIAVSNKAGNDASSGPIANTDGNFVAFYSDATDLVRGDTNQARDVFLRDRGAMTTEIISVNSAGEQANRPSHAQGDAPAISGGGEVVAFYSDATNLVVDDTNAQTDVFVRNRGPQTTEIVSLAADGAQGNGPSLNPSSDLSGNLVAFQSLASNLVAGDTNNLSDIFLRDRVAATTERICDSIQGNGSSFAPAVSADGFVVAFTSAANNLVPGDTNGKLDVFTCDRRSGAIEIISVSSAGVLGNGDSILPAISFDGRFVAYKSLASNLVPNDHNNTVDVFVRDRAQAFTERVSVNFFGGDANEGCFPPSISHDGRFVAFGSAANNIVRDDVNGVPSVFVRDITIGITLLVDLNDAGEQANGGTPDVPPAISGDGSKIGYVSFAFNLNSNDLNGTADVYLGRNPFFCDDDNPCPPPLICVDGMCVEPGGSRTPTPTRTSSPTATFTAGPDDCCQCEVNACEQPDASGCRPDCDIVRSAVCLDNVSCATFTATPTPTLTPTFTAGPDDCCQCEVNACEQPGASGCRPDCDIVRSAVCVDNVNCATFTPTATPTPTNTAGPDDCCQCEANTCEQPGTSGCRPDCDIVRRAVCVDNVNCATFTPTPTATPTASNTAGPNDCCQCGVEACEQPNASGCRPDCDIVRSAVCVDNVNCATFTPTATGGTSTPTVTGGTSTPTATGGTLTPTATGGTLTPTPVVTPTKKDLDRDACQCAVSPQSSAYGSGALLWLSSAAALLWRQRKRKGLQ